MTESIFPKPLLLKEWIYQRWYALVCLICICPSVVMMPWQASRTRIGNYIGLPTMHPPIIHMNAHQALAYDFGQYVQFFSTSGSTGRWAIWIVMGYAALSFASEQSGSSLWFALTAPISRKALLRAKYAFGLAVVLAVCTVLDLYMLCLNGFAHLGTAPVWILYWGFAEAAVLTSAYSLAFCAAILVNNPVIAVMSTYVLCRIPDYFDRLFASAYIRALNDMFTPMPGRVPISDRVFGVIEHLTPMQMYGPVAGIFPYLLWCIAVSVLCYIASQRLFQSVRSEHLLDAIRFPKLRHWMMLWFSLPTGLVITELLFRPLPRSVKAVMIILIAALIWRMATKVLLRSQPRG